MDGVRKLYLSRNDYLEPNAKLSLFCRNQVLIPHQRVVVLLREALPMAEKQKNSKKNLTRFMHRIIIVTNA
jgi:hypothetical protein